MSNIQNELNNIKNAVFGKDVRDSIHNAIKTCYDDASIVNNNANMEVKMARGVHKTLNDRLDSVDSQLEHKANETDLIIERNRITELELNGTTTNLVENKVEKTINEMLENGKLANLTIENNSITEEKLESNFADSINTTIETLDNFSNDNILEIVDKNNNVGFYVDSIGNTSQLHISKTGDNHIRICDDNGNIGFKIYNNPKKIKHIIVTGQSLGAGATAVPCLSSSPILEFRGKNLMFNGGARITDLVGEYGINATGKEINNDLLQYFEDIHERDAGSYGETICTSMLTEANNGNEILLCTNVAVGGRAYVELKRGTVPYNNSIRAIVRAKEKAELLGYDYEVSAIAVVHGEADLFNPNYKDNILEWYDNYNVDIKKITEQTNDIKFLMSQTIMTPYQYNDQYPNHTKSAIDVYEASKVNSNIIITTAQYPFEYTLYDPHMSAKGYRDLGGYFGLAYRQSTDILRENFVGVYPKTFTLNSNVLSIKFNVPTRPLVFDTEEVAKVKDGNYGFVIESENVTIQNVEIKNGDTVKITLSGVPVGDTYISYAYDIKEGTTLGSTANRGNLRDSNNYISVLSKRNMYNWGIIFREKIQ